MARDPYYARRDAMSALDHDDEAMVHATIYVGDQLARLVDILEHAFGTPLSWTREER